VVRVGAILRAGMQTRAPGSQEAEDSVGAAAVR
jgi:hypothetical protein